MVFTKHVHDCIVFKPKRSVHRCWNYYREVVLKRPESSVNIDVFTYMCVRACVCARWYVYGCVCLFMCVHGCVRACVCENIIL